MENEEFKKLHKHQKDLIAETGLCITHVEGGVSHTAGLSIKHGYEIVSWLNLDSRHVDYFLELLGCTQLGVVPSHHGEFLSPTFFVHGDQGRKSPARIGFEEVTDPKLIDEYKEIPTMTWFDPVDPTKITKLYVVYIGDKANRLPWEEGYVPFGQERNI